jgi:uroporphyrinogen decarboxylase
VRPFAAQRDLPHVLETIRLVRRELGERTPVIGFSGAPFTLASYVVEGGHSRTYEHVKRLMYGDPESYGRLMALLADAVVDYLRAQVEAGAQAVQVFDSWAGCLAPFDYERFVLPYVRDVVARVKEQGAPVIYFVNGAAGMLPLVGQAGSDVVGVDWRIDLDYAWEQLGDVAVQGNLDPAALLGPPQAIEERAADILRRAAGRPGHIFNLGHGVLPSTPPDNVKYLVDAVHRLSATSVSG